MSNDSGVAGDGERDAVAVADDEDMDGEHKSEYIVIYLNYIICYIILFYS